MGWSKLVLGWVVCGEWMGQSWDLRQVLQLKWVIVGGVRDASIIEPCLFVVLEQSNAWHFLRFCDPCFQEGFRNEGSECCCLSYHATNVESLGPSSRSNLRFDIWMFELPLFKISSTFKEGLIQGKYEIVSQKLI